MILKDYLASHFIISDSNANKIDYLGTENRDLVQSILKLKFGHREMYFDNDTDVESTVLTVFQMHNYNWTKKYNTILLQYSPLISTDFTDKTSLTNSGADTTTSKEIHTGTYTDDGNTEKTGTVNNNNTVTNNTTDATSKNTFDDNTLTTTDSLLKTGTVSDSDITTNNLKDTVTNTHTNNLNDDQTITNNFGHAINTVKTVTGRDNTTAQDLILKEREIAEYNFFEMIADEITDFITTLNYNYGDAKESEVDIYGF